MVHSSAAATIVLLIVAQVGGRKRSIHGAVPAARAQVALGVRGDGVVELEHRALHLVLRSLRTCQHPVRQPRAEQHARARRNSSATRARAMRQQAGSGDIEAWPKACSALRQDASKVWST